MPFRRLLWLALREGGRVEASSATWGVGAFIADADGLLLLFLDELWTAFKAISGNLGKSKW